MRNSRRDFLKVTGGGLVTALTFSGCSAGRQRGEELARDGSRKAKNLATRLNPPGFKTDASNAISVVAFGDQYFSSRKCVVEINEVEYIFVPTKDKGVEVEGTTLEQAKYLKIAALDRNNLCMDINPDGKAIVHGYCDETADFFVRSQCLGSEPLTTPIIARLRELPEGKRVAHVSEPDFHYPFVLDFGGKKQNKYLRDLRRVAYGEKDGKLVLVPNPTYRINTEMCEEPGMGVVQVMPTEGVYVITRGKFVEPQSFQRQDLIEPKKAPDKIIFK